MALEPIFPPYAPTISQQEDRFPLHKACETGNTIEIKRQLLVCKIDEEDEQGNTPLNALMWTDLPISRKVEIASILFWKGANPDISNLNGDLPIGGIFHCFSVPTIKQKEFVEMDITAALELFCNYFSNVDFHFENGFSLLTFCLSHSLLRPSMYLIAKGASLNSPDGNGMLPIQAFFKDIDYEYMLPALEALIKMGADTSLLSETQLLEDCPEEQEDRIKGIVNKTLWNQFVFAPLRSLRSFTCSFIPSIPRLHEMNEKDCKPLYDILSKIGGNFNAKSDKGKASVYYCTINYGDPFILKHILEQNVDPNIKDPNYQNRTPLTYFFDDFSSCMIAKMTMFKMMLEAGAVWSHEGSINGFGWTWAFSFMALSTNGELDMHRINCMRKWFALMCIKYTSQLKISNRNSLLNKAILEMCAQYGNTTGSLPLLLLRNGYNPNVIDGPSPLHYALYGLIIAPTSRDTIEIIALIKELLNYGANPHAGGLNSPFRTYMRSKYLQRIHPELERALSQEQKIIEGLKVDGNELENLFEEVKKGGNTFKIKVPHENFYNVAAQNFMEKLRYIHTKFEKVFFELDFNVEVRQFLLFNKIEECSLLLTSDNVTLLYVIKIWCRDHKVPAIYESSTLMISLAVECNFDALFTRLENFNRQRLDKEKDRIRTNELSGRKVRDVRTKEMIAEAVLRKKLIDKYVVLLRKLLPSIERVRLERNKYHYNLVRFYVMRILETLRYQVMNTTQNFPVNLRENFQALKPEALLALADVLVKVSISTESILESRINIVFPDLRLVTPRAKRHSDLVATINNMVAEIKGFMKGVTLDDFRKNEELQNVIQMCLVRLRIYLNERDWDVNKSGVFKLIAAEVTVLTYSIDEDAKCFRYPEIDPEKLYAICLDESLKRI